MYMLRNLLICVVLVNDVQAKYNLLRKKYPMIAV